MANVLSRKVPDLIGLQLLLAVQDTGSLAAAGSVLGISQQAASLRMRAMEAQIGLPLVARSSHGSSLTTAGALVAGWAAPVIQAADRLDAGIGSLRTTRNAHLRVAASLTIAEHLAPRWFLALRAGQQRRGDDLTDLELTTANSDAVVRAVLDGSADLGFVEAPGAPAAVRSKVVGQDHLVVVAAPGHPWTRPGRSVSPEELARTPLVSRERGSGTREAFVKGLLALVSRDVELSHPVIELATTAAVRAAIAAGTAPGALSALAVADDLALGRLVQVHVDGLDLRRQLRAVWRDSPQPPAGPARDLVAVAVWSSRA
ncbi:DNA-binding transcriptional regulator, LysR family [Nakamurella panacisegetis]|uniref:DNA-binding transcriptional regulator, LysR family n=1 Tax=Nakamurella panacisegetis TaxID=1090615 RepID=A0A1H0SRV4_9ACTN|nr:LysR family transcriptional regulator [Nakamurella panacisegetis]SDP44433.1 DNA-binding transcriptional regulator, LysR family [Nakamurella panacisegetis]